MRQGAIFDMDGLLLDTERVYVEGWRKTAERFGETSSREFERTVAGTNGARMMEVIHSFFPAVDARAFMDTCLEITGEAFERGVTARPGAEEMLHFLRGRGVKTALASSSSHGRIERNLGFVGLTDSFDALVSGSDVAHGKPAPDIFLFAAEKLGLSPRDCYVFEDGVSGCQAGIAAGCVTVMIPDLFEPTEELKSGCAGIYGSLLLAKDALESGKLT